MILVGQYDSPFVRRVAVSLRVLGFAYEHDTRSVFADFEAMRRVNPLGRIPSLILDDGETLIDSPTILDWLDERVGPRRALVPATGIARRQALRRIALATGAIEKAGSAVYERIVRPSAHRWPEWIERCYTQATGAIEALAALEWPAGWTARSGANHHRLHDPLHAHGQHRPAAIRPLSGARRAVGALRGAA